MDWLTFIANVIDSMAWPLAVVLLVIVLREPNQRMQRTLNRR